MYRCTHVVQMYVHLCVYTCGDQSSLNLEVIPHESCTFWGYCLLAYWFLSLTGTWDSPFSLGSLPSKPPCLHLWALGISLGYKHVPSPQLFLFSFSFSFFNTWVLGIELRPSFWQGRHFSNWATSTAPQMRVVLLWWISCSAGSIIILITRIRWQEFKTYTWLQFM